MNNIENKLINVFVELTHACKSIKNENDYKALLAKYEIIFYGENFNKINSSELKHCLSTHFNIDISMSELNLILPEICDQLKIKYDPLFNANNPNELSCYQITLRNK